MKKELFTPTLPGHRPPTLALAGTLMAQASAPPAQLLTLDPAASTRREDLAVFDLGGGQYAVTRQPVADGGRRAGPRTIQVCADRCELQRVLSDGPVERGLLHLALGDWDWNRCLSTGDRLDLNTEDIACYVWASVCHGQPLPRIELLLTEEVTWNEVMDTASPGDFASTSALGAFFDKVCKDVVDQAGGSCGYGSEEDVQEGWEYGAELNWLMDQEEQDKRIWVRWQEARILDLIRTMALSPQAAR
ncbi:hypothetical protein [Deinococcus radiopugnans]|uniref:Uncharacterized protein n=1 Tax=Deinococcus radiopugnans ATCC 19172 TaxID=585398 RepID=A0A5C4Y7K3_9DEIO|nr:hypothetical protein [Deinococcus radiopugnans]MBB6017780.1 hypothetical protein [Deinococcus radiopugnans ATCC 19172]TNM71421.1 hypothetical protein FHR04_07650 [Deinococcus radiopugnans ATCC 19172]